MHTFVQWSKMKSMSKVIVPSSVCPRMQNPAIPMQKLQDIQRAMELLSACQGPAKNIDEATKRKYQFWDTQPVPKLSKLDWAWACDLERNYTSCVVL